jgi:hypothetical protein
VKRCHGEDTLGVALRENSSMPSLILKKESRRKLLLSFLLYTYIFGKTVYKVFIVGRDCLLFDKIGKYF